MYIIVIGCGRLGSNLARQLSDYGHDVCIIDRDGGRLNVLGSGFNGQRIQGIEFDSDNLMEGGINQADALLAVTSDDNINITVSLIAERIYHVPEIIARINDPDRQYIYDKLNIDTINPVELGAEILKNRLAVKNTDIIAELNNHYEIIEFLVNKKIQAEVKQIEEQFSCIISGVVRDGETILPQRDEVIRCGDRLICTIRKKDGERLIKSCSREAPIWNQ